MAGQSLIEACLVMAITCLLFLGLFQVSQLVAAKAILNHAAARGARAKTVGFNHFMVEKVVQVAAIPVSGRMTTPAYANINQELRDIQGRGASGALFDYALQNDAYSQQAQLELSRIPDFLASLHRGRASGILDYERWDDLRQTVQDSPIGPDAGLLHAHAQMEIPLWLPMHRAFYAADDVDVDGAAYIENHASLYLVDGNR